jgi:hypothetical protein
MMFGTAAGVGRKLRKVEKAERVVACLASLGWGHYVLLGEVQYPLYICRKNESDVINPAEPSILISERLWRSAGGVQDGKP